MNYDELKMKVDVPPRYNLKPSEVRELIGIGEERGYSEAIYMAFKAGWQKRENKEKNDARKIRKA